MDPCAAGLYLVPPAQRLLVPRGDAPQLVDQVLQACRERRIDLLVPTVDAELAPLAQARHRFEEHGIRLALAPLECLQLCRDKHLLLTALRDVVPVPRSELLTADVAAAANSFPAFAKPRRASGSRGAVVVRSRDEINPRFPGTLPLTVAAGVDIPALLVADLSGDALPAERLPFRELMVARYFTEQYFDPGEWRQLCPA